MSPIAYNIALKTPRSIDWVLLLALLPIIAAGLVTMYSFEGIQSVPCESPAVGAFRVAEQSCELTPTNSGSFFSKQLVWLAFSLAAFFAASFLDWRFLRRSDVLFVCFLLGAALLLLLFVAGKAVKGAQSWFDFGPLSMQPVELVKLILILILAKYFSRRHIEIAHIRHMFVSGFYALVLFALVLLQPDFGGAIVIFLIWFGMMLLSGIPKKHLVAVLLVSALSAAFFWASVFKDYQKQRLITFMHPLADVRGSGYNAYQSTIAVGSGGLLGKGVGLGSQSRLQFLPEYETDFIFAAFAEEWGFVGILVLCGAYGIVIWRILANAHYGLSNFEILYGLGLALFIMSHFFIHVGMNLGLLPVTGISLPFMSYGGTHMLVLFSGLGVLMGMRRYRRAAHKEMTRNEFLGAPTPVVKSYCLLEYGLK